LRGSSARNFLTDGRKLSTKNKSLVPISPLPKQDKVENEFYFYRKQKRCRISPKLPEISLFQVVPEEVIKFYGEEEDGGTRR
jgi:hypothetical protein